MKKVIVAGSRKFTDYGLLSRKLEKLLPNPTIVVSGKANGADALGERWAREHGYPVEEHPADWSNLSVSKGVVRENAHGKYNALAGHNRNQKMLDSVLENPDGGGLIAFWDGKSSGTKQMINIAQKAGLRVVVIRTGSNSEQTNNR